MAFNSQNTRFFLTGIFREYKILLLIVVLHIYYTTLYAQQYNDKQSQNFLLSAGAVFNMPTVIDNHFSSLPYTGKKAGAAAYIQIKKQFQLQQLSVFYTKGNLTSNPLNSHQLHQLYLDMNYTRLYSLTAENENPFKVMAGGQLAVLYAKRDYPDFINRKKTFEFAGSLGAALFARYTFREGVLEGVSIGDRLDIPLLSLVQQPAFGSQEAEANLNGESYTFNSFFKSSKLQLAGKFVRIKNNIELTKYFNQRHGFTIGYTWDYYQLGANKEVKQVRHGAFILYTIIL